MDFVDVDVARDFVCVYFPLVFDQMECIYYTCHCYSFHVPLCDNFCFYLQICIALYLENLFRKFQGCVFFRWEQIFR